MKSLTLKNFLTKRIFYKSSVSLMKSVGSAEKSNEYITKLYNYKAFSSNNQLVSGNKYENDCKEDYYYLNIIKENDYDLKEDSNNSTDEKINSNNNDELNSSMDSFNSSTSAITNLNFYNNNNFIFLKEKTQFVKGIYNKSLNIKNFNDKVSKFSKNIEIKNIKNVSEKESQNINSAKNKNQMISTDKKVKFKSTTKLSSSLENIDKIDFQFNNTDSKTNLNTEDIQKNNNKHEKTEKNSRFNRKTIKGSKIIENSNDTIKLANNNKIVDIVPKTALKEAIRKEKSQKSNDLNKLTKEEEDKKVLNNLNINQHLLDENNAVTYFELPLNIELDILLLRNLYYNYLFSRKKDGKFYLNIDDSNIDQAEIKNQKLKELLLNLDYLKLSFDVNDNISVFQSSRISHYSKYVQFLLDNGSVFKCYCQTFEKCTSNCKTQPNATKADFVNDLLNNSTDFSIKFLRINLDSVKLKDKFIINEKIIPLKKGEIAIPSVNYQERVFNLKELDDFAIYKNFSKEISPSFKSCVDDFIHKVTNKIESPQYSVEKDFILSKVLLFDTTDIEIEKNKEEIKVSDKIYKRYTILPDIKLINWNKTELPELTVSYLRKKKILPETILNVALLMGFGNNPLKNANQESVDTRSKNLEDQITLKEDALLKFNLYDIYPSYAYFSSDMIYYFNNKYLNYFFFKFPQKSYFHNPVELKKANNYVIMFKKEFYAVFGNKYKEVLDKWQDRNWRKAIKISIPNLKSFEYLFVFEFFFSSPEYNNEFFNNHKEFISKFYYSKEFTIVFMHDLHTILNSLVEFKGRNINKKISEFLYEKYKLDKSNYLTSKNFYKSLKLIITGSFKIDNVADICDLIGKEESIKRCQKFTQLLVDKNLI
jgi:glutamyl/glutaminyl-tRNA synthetase